MRQLDHKALADALLPVVLEAGRIEMHYYTTGVEIERKADSSPVSAADREAEACLIRGLWLAASGVPVIAEESSAMGQCPAKSRSFFLVDPLDGTREFADHTGEFTVNIGLIVEDRPVFGIIYAPATHEMFVTLEPGAAYETKIAPDAKVVSFEDCDLKRLQTREPNSEALIVLESRSHRADATDAFLKRYRVKSGRRAGSSLKFCYIARGEADFYPRLGPTKEWDTAAGQAILEAAGGSVTRLSGTTLTYGKADVAYLNPHFIAWARGPISPQEAE